MPIAISTTGHEMPAVMASGQVRLLGRPADKVPHYRCARKADPKYLIPESEWVEFDRTRTVIPLLDQGQIGECTGEAGVNTLMVARDIAGESFNLLSGSMLYAQVNGGVDNGASLTDVVVALQKTGVCLASQVPEGFYKLRQIPSTAMTTASRFMAPEGSWVTASTFDQAGSLAQLGYQLYFSVTAGDSWDVSNFTSDGVPPFISGYGNHAQSGGEAMKKGSDGRWLIKVRNSWGSEWGLGGFYWIDSRFLDQQQGLELYGLYYPNQDPQDPNIGPVVG